MIIDPYVIFFGNKITFYNIKTFKKVNEIIF